MIELASCADPVRDPDAWIMEIAARQYGVVSRTQLLDAGFTLHWIEHRVKRRHLRPIFRGVYAVGPVLGRYGREMAAVLACGEAAVLSYRSAAVVHAITPERSDAAPVDVSLRIGCRAPSSGILVHRPSDLPDDEVKTLHGVPITTVGRTIVDLAGVMGAPELERCVARAIRHNQATTGELERLLVRHPRGKGAGRLRSLLASAAEPAFTRSEAESKFLALVKKARLGVPRTNRVVERFEVDFLWAKERLIVEIDGAAFHSGRIAFESDRRRDAVLTAAGYRVMRVTWQQLTRDPMVVIALVALALGQSAQA